MSGLALQYRQKPLEQKQTVVVAMSRSDTMSFKESLSLQPCSTEEMRYADGAQLAAIAVPGIVEIRTNFLSSPFSRSTADSKQWVSQCYTV